MQSGQYRYKEIFQRTKSKYNITHGLEKQHTKIENYDTKH